jgi:glucose/arabinose dehydrogenase
MRSFVIVLLAACGATSEPSGAMSPDCTYESEGDGPAGAVAVRVETVASGLSVPWGLAFLSNGDILFTERPGRLRLIAGGQLVADPVLTVPVHSSGEAGLLGVAVKGETLYLYNTYLKAGARTNRVVRYKLAADHRSATEDKVLLDDIPGAEVHDGGRLRIGPDGQLYAGTGDARQPALSRDTSSRAGKILRIGDDGTVTVVVRGIRNTQGFDWLDDGSLVIGDHGPSGDTGRTGHDEINVAREGDDLGWPDIFGCESRDGLISPSITWRSAVPPGGIAVYRNGSISEWRGSILVGTLRSEHVHRVVLDGRRVKAHEVYLKELGRTRDVVVGPDGELYVTTSNCDGRGTCPAEKDKIVRVRK